MVLWALLITGRVQELAVFLPAVQRGQGVELAFDRPVRADHGVFAPQQPDTHDLLQQLAAVLPIGQGIAQGQQLFAQGLFGVASGFGGLVHNQSIE